MHATTELVMSWWMRWARGVALTAGFLAVAAAVGAASSSQRLEEGLRLELELRSVRRCYNDSSITTDEVNVRLILTNTSPAPVAMVPGAILPGRTRLWESIDGKTQERLVFDLAPELAFGPAPKSSDDDGLAVLWPGDSVAADRTVTVITLRRGVTPIAGVVRRARHLLAVTGYARVAPFESELQALSSTRVVGLESLPIPLDLSGPMPIEFCR